jgi:hypothetical protein
VTQPASGPDPHARDRLDMSYPVEFDKPPDPPADEPANAAPDPGR